MPGADYSINTEYLFYRIYHLLADGATAQNFLARFTELWFWLRFISFPITVALAIFVIYLVRKIIILRRAENLEFRTILEAASREKPKTNEAWEKVLAHMASDNPNEWKLGIIAADNLLDDLVKTMGYPGDGLGERLKNIEPSDFSTLQDAWDGHKIRNRIAHETGYVPTEHEARGAIASFRKVFEEFHII